MDNQDKKVIIQDIDMPFNKMVIFGIKWMFAMIPALLAFYFIIFILVGIIGIAGLGIAGWMF